MIVLLRIPKAHACHLEFRQQQRSRPNTVKRSKANPSEIRTRQQQDVDLLISISCAYLPEQSATAAFTLLLNLNLWCYHIQLCNAACWPAFNLEGEAKHTCVAQARPFVPAACMHFYFACMHFTCGRCSKVRGARRHLLFQIRAHLRDSTSSLTESSSLLQLLCNEAILTKATLSDSSIRACVPVLHRMHACTYYQGVLVLRVYQKGR